MELRARDVVCPHHRGHRSTVVGFRHHCARRGGEVEGVYEIGVQPSVPGSDAGQQGVLLVHVERIPTHMRNLKRWIVGPDGGDVALEPAEPRRDFEFEAALGHQLRAHADAEKRPSLRAHAVLERLDHARHGGEPRLAVGERPDAGQHHAIRIGHDLGLAAHGNGSRPTAFARRALKRLGGGMEIARTIVDDDDTLHGH
jgi:hypothetical protein